MSLVSISLRSVISLGLLLGMGNPATGACEEEVARLRPIEAEASVETIRMLDSYFQNAWHIEIMFSNFGDIELRGYEFRIEAMRYSYEYHCNEMCPTFASRLSDKLKTSRQADGTCPWITAAILFRDSSGTENARVLVGGNGHCLAINGKTYALGKNSDLAYLFEASTSIF